MFVEKENNSNVLIEAFNEGYHYYQIAESSSKNPYSINSEHNQWFLGYVSAQIDCRCDENEDENVTIH